MTLLIQSIRPFSSLIFIYTHMHVLKQIGYIVATSVCLEGSIQPDQVLTPVEPLLKEPSFQKPPQSTDLKVALLRPHRF